MMTNKNRPAIFAVLFLIAGVTIGYFFLGTEDRKRTLPDSSESAQIALKTTLAFAEAVNAKDLSLFRFRTTTEFKEKFSHAQFEQAFSGFIEQNINLLPVAKLSPVFHTPPSMSEDGTLTLTGYFPTRPSQVEFDYSFVWRKDDWKITGISLQINPVDNAAPSP